jgi:hypothetical protein
MIAAANDPLHNELFGKDRLPFTEHFASAIPSSGLPDDIMVHLPSILADDKLQVFQSPIGSKGAYAHWVTKYAVRIGSASAPEHSCLRLFLFVTHSNYCSTVRTLMTMVPNPPKYRHS